MLTGNAGMLKSELLSKVFMSYSLFKSDFKFNVH